MQLRHALHLATIMVFAVLAYLPSFGVPFLFDDFHNIVFNPRVQPDSLAEVPTSLDARGDRDRPVAMLTFALNFLHAGLDAGWYHAVNLAIHLTNAVLLYAIVALLAGAPGSPPRLTERAALFAFTVALIWAVHPVNTQAVTYIVQRMASLAATFYLSGLLLFTLWRSGRLSTAWVAPGFAAAFVLGFATKANVVTLPLAVLLLDIAFYGGVRRVHGYVLGAALAGTAVVALLYAGPQLAFLTEAPPRRDFSGLERLLTQGRVIWHYISLLLWPDAARLQLDYDFTVSRGLFVPPMTFVAWTTIATLTVVAMAGLRRAAWPAFGWLFFLLALSVESSVVLLELVFEHRVYLPSTMLIAGLVAPLFALNCSATTLRSGTIATMAVAGLLAWQTMVRNQEWQDTGSFWAGELERGASPYRAGLNGGLAHLREGKPVEALALFRRIESSGVADTPLRRGKVAQLIGEAHFRSGDFGPALTAFRRAIEDRPTWVRTAYFIGMSFAQLGEFDKAEPMLDQMRAERPDSVFTASLAAELHAQRGDTVGALAALRARLEGSERLKAVDRSFLYLHMGNLYRQIGRVEPAADSYRAALEADRENWAATAALEALTPRSAGEQLGGAPR